MTKRRMRTGQKPVRSRDEQVAYMVALGYSPDFAERFVPLTEREARKRGVIVQYVSAYRTINTRE